MLEFAGLLQPMLAIWRERVDFFLALLGRVDRYKNYSKPPTGIKQSGVASFRKGVNIIFFRYTISAVLFRCAIIRSFLTRTMTTITMTTSNGDTKQQKL